MEDYLLEKKFEIMLDMNNRKIANEINRLSSMISSLSGEIASIKREMGKIQKTAAFVKEPPEGFRETQSNSVRLKPSEEPKPRFGDYTPEDVPIGKIFYFGNKR